MMRAMLTRRAALIGDDARFAMASTFKLLLAAAVLDRIDRGLLSAVASSHQLIAWLMRSETGLQRIRAGLLSTWSAGDKTGTGENGADNARGRVGLSRATARAPCDAAAS